jgi:hypothetical protein
VVIACPQGQWHVLPALIIRCALRAQGWDTTLLVASTSSLRLDQHRQDLGSAAVAVSCTMSGAYLPSGGSSRQAQQRVCRSWSAEQHSAQMIGVRPRLS